MPPYVTCPECLSLFYAGSSIHAPYCSAECCQASRVLAAAPEPHPSHPVKNWCGDDAG